VVIALGAGASGCATGRADFGVGGRYLGHGEPYGDVGDHGVMSGSWTGFFDERFGLEVGGALSFPSLSDTVSSDPGNVHVHEDAFLSETWTGLAYRFTAEGSPVEVRAGAGPTWVRANVTRALSGAVSAQDESTVRSMGGQFHVTTSVNFPGGFLLGLDLRLVAFTQGEFFGDELPGVEGDMDYFQFLLVFGWWW